MTLSDDSQARSRAAKQLWTATEELQEAVKSLQSLAYTAEQTEDGYQLHPTDMHVLINPIMRRLGLVQRVINQVADMDGGQNDA